MEDIIMTPERERDWAEYRKIIAGLRLMDDDFMSIAFNNDNELTAFVLRIILEKDDLIVTKVRTQVESKSATHRSVTLDVKATDSEGKIYNIEVQRSDRGSGVRRARYHSSALDHELLSKGDDFDKLVDTYVIFITERDKFRRGLPMYHIDRTIAELGHESFGDGAHIIYVNGEYRADDPIGRLMHDFSSASAKEMYYKTIAERVKYFKETEGGNTTMCRAIEEVVDKKIDMKIENIVEKKQHAQAVEIALKFLRSSSLPLDIIAQNTSLPLSEVESLAKTVKA